MPIGKLKTQKSKLKTEGFTLIELLVVVSIVAILIALSIFALQGARQSSRDAQRKSDLERIRSGLEIYKSDCGVYPPVGGTGGLTFGSDLVGSSPLASCSTSSIYIKVVPKDLLDPTRAYLYVRGSTNNTYELCAALEQGSGNQTCGGSSNCGTGVGVSCNYKVTNP